jgi:hypothetical protein
MPVMVKCTSTELNVKDYSPVEFETYRLSNGLEIVTSTVDSPLYALYVNIPVLQKSLLNLSLPRPLCQMIKAYLTPSNI